MSLEKITPKNTEYAKQTLRNRGDMFSVYILKLIESFENTEDNPIKDNRIVKDKTFAIRLLGFALDIQCSDPCSEDEKESMVSYATTLLKYQIETATEIDEITYLDRCKAESELNKGLKFLDR